MNPPNDSLPSTDDRATRQALAACKHIWEVSGIDPVDIDDMLDELHSHLADAAVRGRSTEDVVGPDVVAFARDWAKAHTRRSRRWLRLAIDAVGALALVALLLHLLLTTTRLPVRPGALLAIVLLLGIQLGWRSTKGGPPFRVFLVASAVAVVPALVVHRLLPDTVLFRLPLWITGPVAAVALAVAYRDTRRRSARRRSATITP